jgi:hypothetical protein
MHRPGSILPLHPAISAGGANPTIRVSALAAHGSEHG